MIYPNIPDLPGVPPVLRNPLAAAAATRGAEIIGKFFDQFKAGYGVYNESGEKILNPDSILSLDYVNQRKISSFPIEKGSFNNYNKVNDPFRDTIRACRGGSVEDRMTFIQELLALSDSLELVKLVTPEYTMINVNMEGFTYRREQKAGANIIIAECRFVEIRIPGLQPENTAITTHAKSPTAKNKTFSGLANAIVATVSIASTATLLIGKNL